MKKATGCKGKKADVHVIDKAPEGPKGVLFAYCHLIYLFIYFFFFSFSFAM